MNEVLLLKNTGRTCALPSTNFLLLWGSQRMSCFAVCLFCRALVSWLNMPSAACLRIAFTLVYSRILRILADHFQPPPPRPHFRRLPCIGVVKVLEGATTCCFTAQLDGMAAERVLSRSKTRCWPQSLRRSGSCLRCTGSRRFRARACCTARGLLRSSTCRSFKNPPPKKERCCVRMRFA